MSDLSAPLSRRRDRTAAQKAQRIAPRSLPVARLAAAGIAVLLLAAAARIVLVDTPNGGQPSAQVALNPGHAENVVVDTNLTPGSGAIEVGPEIDPGEVDASLESDTPPAADSGQSAALAVDAFGARPDLVESTEFGPLPQIGKDGATPFSAYARASVSAAGADGKPRIAVIVTGLGINLGGTLEAISKLPDNITLAFAPYGKSLDRTVGAARSEGHELFLEVPLEPFDYPDNDPGPDTLLTGQAPRDNMDKLYRVMGKFAGYAGIVNNMGARFTSSAADFGPMMEEVGARGLGYIDDGSSNRSLARQLAEANRVPFGRADLMLDSNPSRAQILAELTALEEKATQQGSAIGMMTALPVSVSTITEWAHDLAERGFELVPASALMAQ